jgi:hypothetical protein
MALVPVNPCAFNTFPVSLNTSPIFCTIYFNSVSLYLAEGMLNALCDKVTVSLLYPEGMDLKNILLHICGLQTIKIPERHLEGI